MLYDIKKHQLGIKNELLHELLFGYLPKQNAKVSSSKHYRVQSQQNLYSRKIPKTSNSPKSKIFAFDDF